MKKQFLYYLCILLATICFAAMTGCAANDIQLKKPVYQPVGETPGTGGMVVLASSLEGTTDGIDRIQWILGEVRSNDGRITGNVTSQVAPAVLVRDALNQELLKAGYTVQQGNTIPENVSRGLRLTVSNVSLDETRSLIKVDAECRVSFTVEIWRNGAKTNTLSFESRFGDVAVTDREKLHQDVLQKAFASVFSRAVPAIMEQLNK